ncbi:LysR family transcriptional regulator [Ruegeria sp. HKCCD8929]|uniref:LysR family transcriptional regulator n=1 Tax=Ruegeria sp. HKCCD8929 TaxID=2683006 RepID=UPI0014889F86|nr:LysR family transcriptional regulator [Ruegeria sp. HKCCD8929]
MIRDTSLGEIIAFVTVARLGSFALAADELLVTQSALSKRIKKLEDSIGAPLLDRTTRSVAVSTLGREFLPKAKRIIEDYNRSLNDMSELVKVRKGIVTLSCNMTLSDTLLPEIIDRFKTTYPNIRVRVHEDSSPQALERVLSGQSELAFGTLGESHPELDFEQLIDDRFVIACHKSHPLATATSTTWEEVKNQNFILLRPESGTRKLLHRHLGALYDVLSNDIQVGHFHSQLSLVARGIGIAATPSLIRLSRRDLEIAIIPISEPTISRKLGILTYKGRALSPAAEKLREVAASVMQGADG